MFLLTLNMKSLKGLDVHQVIVSHPAESTAQLAHFLNSSDYLVFRELHHVNSQIVDQGELIIASSVVAKAKPYKRIAPDAVR
jgi:hypothetical protein